MDASLDDLLMELRGSSAAFLQSRDQPMEADLNKRKAAQVIVYLAECPVGTSYALQRGAAVGDLADHPDVVRAFDAGAATVIVTALCNRASHTPPGTP